MSHSVQIFYIFLLGVFTTYALLENSQINLLRRTYEQCGNKTDVFKCLKIKALKLMENLSRTKKLELFGVVEITQEKSRMESNRTSRLLSFGLSEDALSNIRDEKISDLLYQAAENFLETRSININMPKLMDEARRRKKGQKYMGPFMAAMAIKGTMMAMAYKGIAAMAGAALILGKIALTLAAILGLKKLVSPEKEKTTLEIIKHPSYSNSHSYSSSYEEGEGHSGHSGYSGHYGRSSNIATEMAFIDKIKNKRY